MYGIHSIQIGQFSCSVMSNSLWPHGLQHARLLCPLPTPGVCSNSCPLSRWCHPTISSSVIPFSSCLQSFPASGSFPMSVLCIRWPKYWSFSFSISPSNEYSELISFRIEHSDKLMKYLLMCSFTIFIEKWIMLLSEDLHDSPSYNFLFLLWHLIED